eukprot:1679427-Prymnesium_polylepis.2
MYQVLAACQQPLLRHTRERFRDDHKARMAPWTTLERDGDLVVDALSQQLLWRRTFAAREEGAEVDGMAYLLPGQDHKSTPQQRRAAPQGYYGARGAGWNPFLAPAPRFLAFRAPAAEARPCPSPAAPPQQRAHSPRLGST